MKISREVKTAILVISGIILFIYIYNFLKGDNLLTSSRIYYAYYDNVEGLSPSTPVTINGLNVGKVQTITFDEDGSGRLLVKMIVENNFKFSENSTAELYEAGLIGGKAIAIVPANDGAPAAKDEAVLKSEIKAGLSELVNRRLTPLQEKIENTMVSGDSLLTNFNTIFDDNTKKNLQDAIAELKQTIVVFKEMGNSVNALVSANDEKLGRTLDNFENVSSDLAQISDSLARADLAGTLKELQGAVENFNQLLSSVNNGEGSVGKLLNDEKLYANLEGASKQLEMLLQDMKLNPKRYVHFSLFGKRPKPYDAQENMEEDSLQLQN
ncbi:MlaD family protein [Aegicerativicinus sediminis]|uniref:MlaD family protein n=1 Tax=Aegicerativicinus sediminis TaxID=2893202 RepID=UPI001E5194DE|nr:MlaD family protein [Aegicerativicinus sediminis]